jgi:outer membrane protein TolC
MCRSMATVIANRLTQRLLPGSVSKLGLLPAVLFFLVCCGCQAKQRAPVAGVPMDLLPQAATLNAPTSSATAPVRLVSHQQLPDPPPALPPRSSNGAELLEPAVAPMPERLENLEALAVANNPVLRRMRQEASAEWAKARYASKLPDPTVSSMFFLPPMNFEPDRQVAELQIMQMIPWLARLSAEERRAQLEAMAAENQYHSERVRIVGDIRANWYKLFVLHKQIDIAEAEKTQIQALVNTAGARVATGNAQPGDVLMATLELSNLQEQLLSFRQQERSTVAELNRLTGRDSSSPISPPNRIDAMALPPWTHEWLLSVAISSEPELVSARLRTAATRWGIEVARLKRRPDLTFSGGWVVMDAQGAMTPDAGADSWTLGVSATLPIWHRDYDAMVAEASRRHFAAHASEEEIIVRLDATLRDLWEQAKAAQQTVELYEKTILPQARQTYEADQQSLANNTVTFDRVIRDYRTLLGLELGYHRAVGQLAIALARIQEAVGMDLTTSPITQPQPPPENRSGQ